eukprot:GHVH01007960.1.p1 GENE.GHVH01007960.1~~GHVH01007960.1.p1  ORF type:complete len:429 (+),score=45.41 GHVH01007960.1:182-1468(+)
MVKSFPTLGRSYSDDKNSARTVATSSISVREGEKLLKDILEVLRDDSSQMSRDRSTQLDSVVEFPRDVNSTRSFYSAESSNFFFPTDRTALSYSQQRSNRGGTYQYGDSMMAGTSEPRFNATKKIDIRSDAHRTCRTDGRCATATHRAEGLRSQRTGRVQHTPNSNKSPIDRYPECHKSIRELNKGGLCGTEPGTTTQAVEALKRTAYDWLGHRNFFNNFTEAPKHSADLPESSSHPNDSITNEDSSGMLNEKVARLNNTRDRQPEIPLLPTSVLPKQGSVDVVALSQKLMAQEVSSTRTLLSDELTLVEDQFSDGCTLISTSTEASVERGYYRRCQRLGLFDVSRSHRTIHCHQSCCYGVQGPESDRSCHAAVSPQIRLQENITDNPMFRKILQFRRVVDEKAGGYALPLSSPELWKMAVTHPNMNN